MLLLTKVPVILEVWRYFPHKHQKCVYFMEYENTERIMATGDTKALWHFIVSLCTETES